MHTTKARFPNLKIAYLSSRIYAGYALSDQIAGKPELNYDPAKGAVRAPWIAWGPYLWADGMKDRGDGLVWPRENFGADGMHPSNSGREKVAKLLLQFLKTDPAAKPWFLARSNSGQMEARRGSSGARTCGRTEPQGVRTVLSICART